MADYWTAPKTNWTDNDGIGYADLNRIEANISANRDGNFRKMQGFDFTVDNSVVGQDGVITLLSGSCYSDDGFPMRSDANIVKNLNAWVAGNGVTVGGMAAAVTVAKDVWYYMFVLMNPIDGAIELMFDDNPSGTNVSSGIYTKKRASHAFKTRNVGGDGGFDICEMYAVGDHVFIHPPYMFPTNGGVLYTGASFSDNTYTLKTLTDASRGLALPAKAVRAQLNVSVELGDIGVMSSFGGHFTVSTFATGAVRNGEAVFQNVRSGSGTLSGWVSGDCAIMIPDTGTINIAQLSYGGGTHDVLVRVHGYLDERLV